MPEELRAAIVLFASLLDERQRRLFAGLEALKCGWGGDRRIARLLGIDPSTVASGRRQLVERDVELDRVRRAGGGRRPTEKNTGSHCLRPSLDGARDGRRPGQRLEVDTPYDRQGRRRTERSRHRHLPADGRSTAQGDGLFAARQPQEARRGLASEARRPVSTHHRTARALRRRQRSGHQRRYEKEGTRRRVPQSRRQVGPQSRTGQRPRTSAPMPRASPSPTASTTRGPTPAPSSPARRPTPRRSPSTASRNGGAQRAASTIPTPTRCRSWPTAAAATVARRAPGN